MTTSSNSSVTSHNGGGAGQQFGDTTLTKVFVGGLAWETPKDAMRDHFDKYGEILEAVIISDKLTGRSKGYGFVTFKEAEAAKKACEDATPIINGRRANCNLASLGARRQPRSAGGPPPASTTPPLLPPIPHHHQPLPHHPHHHHHHNQQGSNVGVRSTSANHHQVQWYYPAAASATTFSHHNHHAVPFYGYGYAPTYIATDMGYNQKLSYGGGAYMSGGGGQYGHPQVYPGTGQAAAVMPYYPVYQYYGGHHQSAAMGLPMYSAAATLAAGPIPTIISKQPSMVAAPPTSGN
ncbi:unnamed protein product [Linum tenue]|uniref:RRM domain-containing protein n=1 Tax=Linum tenue TaxID=586396 RepID=A0AAV0JSR4_9ROSI|nr:unnamed protein product [Linum tenue]